MVNWTYGELAYMANWLIWRNGYGKLAYGKLGNGEMTSYHKLKFVYVYFVSMQSKRLSMFGFETTGLMETL